MSKFAPTTFQPNFQLRPVFTPASGVNFGKFSVNFAFLLVNLRGDAAGKFYFNSLWEFIGMPFGLCNATATMRRLRHVVQADVWV